MTCATYETDPETCATRYRAGRCKHCSAGLLASLDAQAAEMAPATPAPGMCPCGLPVRERAKPGGRPALYCGDACRQRAKDQRRRSR